WFCFKVIGPLDLAAVGILAALVDPLRDKGISVFALSTFDTDYLLVPEVQRGDAISALEAAGHRIER
ncbi:MAG TPA: ACT domain-containing protein, partial [Acidimicrobiales bacterium]|nr:ACT domain-containing protein [Acidimicrobiales bacterium]